MSANSPIEWTHHTFNPWWGCEEVSPGCDHCYAKRHASRFADGKELWGPGSERREFGEKHWNAPLHWNRRAKKEGVRHRVFCASMSDVFDKNAPIGARARLFALIKATPHLDWLLLTKRVGNVKKMLPADWGNGYENVWLGISTVNQHEADRDFWKLLALPALVHFVSVGPMLGYVDIVRAHAKAAQEAERRNIQISSKVDWVICEGESGPHARPMHLAWPHALQKDCELLDIPFHFKQWGEWVPRGPESSGYPVVEKVPRIRLTDAGENGSRLDAKGGYEVWMNRAGKRRAGRLLDGKVYDQYPVIPIMPAEKVPA